MSPELKEKLRGAKSVRAVKSILTADSPDWTAETAEEIWQELSRRRQGQELSLDELDAVSGGVRDWLKDGCASTVEYGSWCWTNDNCATWDVAYLRGPTGSCPHCGGGMRDGYELRDHCRVFCRICTKCGYKLMANA